MKTAKIIVDFYASARDADALAEAAFIDCGRHCSAIEPIRGWLACK